MMRLHPELNKMEYRKGEENLQRQLNRLRTSFSEMLKDCLGREPFGINIMGWISVVKIILKITRVNSFVDWFHHWILGDRYRQELDDTRQRVLNLEEEIIQLKLQQKKLIEFATKSNWNVCSCLKHGGTDPSSNQGCVSRPPPLPPPPPPPPPPPAPVLPPVMSFTKRLSEERGDNKKASEKSKKSSSGVLLITPGDLQRIKLRTPQQRQPVNGRKNGSIHPLVTLDDLKSKNLNRVIMNIPNKDNIHQRLAQEVIAFKCGLKKTDVKRSPGGTPLISRKRKLRKGNGLAPVMATALRKKFVSVHSSPDTSDSSVNSPLSTDTSPFG